MKKIFLIISLLFLTSCFGPSKDEIQKAKNQMLNNTGETFSNSGVDELSIKNEEKNEEKSYFKVNHLTSENFIDVNEVENIENIKEKLDIKGIVNNPDIEKIKVSFKNSNSKFPSDEYELKTFKKGNKEFLYRAYKNYSVLDLGLNIYTIEGFVGDNLVSKIEVHVFLSEKKNENTFISTAFTGNLNQESFTGEILEKLPASEYSYGTPSINDSEKTFTYSNLNNFIGSKNSEVSSVNCENFADYLKQNYTWYYWNTCRPVLQENNFSVYVLTLSGDEYKYEKHYISGKVGVYMTYLLEKGSGLKQSDLQTKSDELKSMKFDTQNADLLFNDLLK